jgi:hypothetical protein
MANIVIIRNFVFVSDRKNFTESTYGQDLFINRQYYWKDTAMDWVGMEMEKEMCSNLVFKKFVQNGLY